MKEARDLVESLLQSGDRNLFVICLSFEDRCKSLPRILKANNAPSAKNEVLCFDLPNTRVCPMAVHRRAEIKKELSAIVGHAFLPPDQAMTRIREFAAQEDVNIVLDVSGMPRRHIFECLRALIAIRQSLQGVHVVYAHPDRYAPESLEIPSPRMPLLFDTPTVRDKQRVKLALFPGFNTGEAALALAQVIDPNKHDQEIHVSWFFGHDASQYSFYERSYGQHIVMLRSLTEQITNEPSIRLYRIHDFQQVSRKIAELWDDLEEDQVLLVAGLGPRIASIPLFLTATALRLKQRRAVTGVDQVSQRAGVNVLVPQALYYNSLRSQGEGPRMMSWNLEEELSEIHDHLLAQGAGGAQD